MSSFKSGSYHTKKGLLQHWLLNLAYIIVFLTALYYFDLYTDNLLLVAIILFIMAVIDFIRESNRVYINEITIDPENRKIVFYCYGFWKGDTIFERSFDELKFKIARDWDGSFRRRAPVIFFFKAKPANFYISTAKDRFTRETLDRLVVLLEQLAKPAA